MITFEKLQLAKEIIIQLVLLDYPYFKELYKLIAIDISKSQGFDDDPKAMQQIKFTENLNTGRKTISDFFTKNYESTVILFFFNKIPV